ncbi:MAG: hypothetical protein DPW09_38075 [Anaerolineae bacterium]|nr:DUF1444 family protein [Anaerolineales bacterium]MCQ3979264.1 hypothetical protein [Anaerolineae bacterium]
MTEKMMTPEEYQRHVLLLLTALFPEKYFEATDDPMVIAYQSASLGLDNLYTVYRREQLGPKGRDEYIEAHFSRIITNLNIEGEIETISWAEVQEKVLLQLMPARHRQVVPLIYYPLSAEVDIGVVVDLPTAYSYVREKDLARWGVTPAQLYETALKNLEQASAGLEVQFVAGPERFMVIETKDSFDAARLLLSEIRRFVAEELGEPCLAAIPNRDFLIFWSASNSADFNQHVRAQVQRDFETQPYALTAQIFVVTVAGLMVEEDD